MAAKTALVGGRSLERRHGRPAASLDESAWQQAGTWLGCGLATIATCLAPQRIVIGGGGVALGAGERLLAPARRELARRLRLVSSPSVQLAGLAYASAAAGSLVLAAQAAGLPAPSLQRADICRSASRMHDAGRQQRAGPVRCAAPCIDPARRDVMTP